MPRQKIHEDKLLSDNLNIGIETGCNLSAKVIVSQLVETLEYHISANSCRENYSLFNL